MVETDEEESAAFKRIAEDVVRDLFGLAEAQVPRDGIPDARAPNHDNLGAAFGDGGLERLDIGRGGEVFIVLFVRIAPFRALEEVHEDDGIHEPGAFLRRGRPTESRVDEGREGLLPFAGIIVGKIVVDNILREDRALGMRLRIAAVAASVTAVVRRAHNHDALGQNRIPAAIQAANPRGEEGRGHIPDFRNFLHLRSAFGAKLHAGL